MSLPEVIDDARCRSYLAASTEGRLAYPTGRGPVRLVVPYVITDLDVLLVAVAPFNEACQYVPGREVVLEVSGPVSAHEGWVVTATGTAVDHLVVGGRDSDRRRDTSAVGGRPGLQRAVTGEIASLAIPITTLRGHRTVSPTSPGRGSLLDAA